VLPGFARGEALREEEGVPEAGEEEPTDLTYGGRFKVYAVATEPHFVDHLAPVWKALPEEVRGTFYCGGNTVTPRRSLHQAIRFHGITEACSGMPKKNYRGLGMTAASGDLNRMVRAAPNLRVVFFEHGCGLSYNRTQNSYAGARNRPHVDTFIFPNEISASKQRAVHPDRRIEVIGSSPRLDPWANNLPKMSSPPVVALSFHWECQVVPETRSSWYWYRKRLDTILDQGWTVIGHGHPRIIDTCELIYNQYGIEVVRNFDDVMKRADVYCVDNSSTLYEFAATNRPVVVMNCPRYRQSAHHGLRFWDHLPGVESCGPDKADNVRGIPLVDAIRKAIEDPREVRKQRQDAVRHVYPHHDGHSTERAVKIVLETMLKSGEANPPPEAWRPDTVYQVVVNGEILRTDRPLFVAREAQMLAKKRGGVVQTI